MPAIISALNSIHFQSEAHRLSVRAGLMVQELANYRERISKEEADIEKNKDGCDFFAVLKLMDDLANTLTDEVAEWSLIYEKVVYEQG